jgi:ParB family chromosome partitioning protein
MAQSGFAAERTHVAKLLGRTGDDEGDEVASIARSRSSYGGEGDALSLLPTLLALEDSEVMRILTFVMAETLEADAALIDQLGAHIGTDMKEWWKADQTFLDLCRDRAATLAMLREVAGDITADAHKTSKVSVMKKIIFDCLKGEGRTKVEGWQPRYMAFPAGFYTHGVSQAQPSPDANMSDDHGDEDMDDGE